MNNCENCKFWKPEKAGEQLARGQAPRPQGVCRYDPPRIFPIPAQGALVFHTLFPLTEAAEWCGRHVPVVTATHQD